uniref:Uncharacterized protein n=1 Tax=Oreochromis niloticus TaxID=8128 RepID=A0A669E9A0_ORENI
SLRAKLRGNFPASVVSFLREDTVRLRSAVGLLGEGPASMSAVPTQMVFPGSGSRGKSGKMGIVPRCRSLEPLVSPGSPSSPLYIS